MSWPVKFTFVTLWLVTSAVVTLELWKRSEGPLLAVLKVVSP